MQPMLNIALRAARSAGELIFRSIERLDVISVNEKDAKDYVTEVDRAAEQTIVAALRKAYPTHAIAAPPSTVAACASAAARAWKAPCSAPGSRSATTRSTISTTT